MLESAGGQEFIERIEATKRAMIGRMVTDAPFAAPSLASFEIGDLRPDESRTWTYSANV